MINSRESILGNLRRQSVSNVDLPGVPHDTLTRFDDPVATFVQMVQFAGGSCETVDSLETVRNRLESQPVYRSARNILSEMGPIPGNVDLARIDQPHQLENLDFVILKSPLAVAENGAVWLTDERLKFRVSFFITQHLVIVVEATSIVHTMHEAYELARPPQPGFGVFLAGPSKTADIEQSLVIGAHGCRELQVFVLLKP